MLQALLNRLSGYRKVIVTLLVFITSVIMVLTKVITSDNWVSLNQIIIPAFLASNLISKFANGKEKSE